MKDILISGLVGAALLVLPLGAASVSSVPPSGPNSYFTDRAEPLQGSNWNTHLFEQVKQDVEQIRASHWPHRGDDFRLNNTLADLNDLQAKFQGHVYDDTVLQRSIDALSRVASYNRMPQRDRKIMNADIHRLRLFRRNHADWYYEHAPQDS